MGVRKLTDHYVEAKCANLIVNVLDDPGQGGACHLYEIRGFDTESNKSCPTFGSCIEGSSDRCTILFQNGPIGESSKGANGIQHEALLSILIDRLRGFQSGPYACEANAVALEHCEKALGAMMDRTRDRMERGVEGTHRV